jgi:hypothetical protein
MTIAADSQRPINFARRSLLHSALHYVRVAPFREDFANGIFNAKTQGPKGAKSFFRLGDFAVLFTRIAHFWQNFPNHLAE